MMSETDKTWLQYSNVCSELGGCFIWKTIFPKHQCYTVLGLPSSLQKCYLAKKVAKIWHPCPSLVCLLLSSKHPVFLEQVRFLWEQEPTPRQRVDCSRRTWSPSLCPVQPPTHPHPGSLESPEGRGRAWDESGNWRRLRKAWCGGGHKLPVSRSGDGEQPGVSPTYSPECPTPSFCNISNQPPTSPLLRSMIWIQTLRTKPKSSFLSALWGWGRTKERSLPQ